MISSIVVSDFYHSRRNLRFAIHPQLRPASIGDTAQINRDLLESVAAVGSGQAVMMYTYGSGRHLDIEQRRDLQSDSETADLKISVNIWMEDDKFRLFRDEESVSEISGASSVRAGRILLIFAVCFLFTTNGGAILFA